MKLLHFAALMGLLAFVGCEENEVEDDMPATMPGQYDSDVDVDDDRLLNDDPATYDNQGDLGEPRGMDPAGPGYTSPLNNDRNDDPLGTDPLGTDPGLGEEDPANAGAGGDLNTGSGGGVLSGDQPAGSDSPSGGNGDDEDVVEEVGDGNQL